MSLKTLQRAFLLSLLALPQLTPAQALKVNITPDLAYVDVQHGAQPVRIQRIQDTGHKIIDDFAKTSRPCPEFCIHPIKVAEGVETLGELELLDFMTRQVKTGSGLVILTALGARAAGAGRWDYQQARTLALWCNGPWCDQSPRAIRALLKLGYPAAKLKYYRGGMQEWKLLGLTTVVPAGTPKR